MGIVVRDAKLSDLPDILRVNHSLIYSAERTDSFLIQKRPREEFEKLLKLCKYFFVAEVDGRIAGYITVLDEAADYLENEIFSFYQRYKDFVFIDQIAVLPDYHGKGVGRAMYKKLLSVEKKKILLDIMIKPLKQQSITAHEAMGFKPVGDIIYMKNGWEAKVFEVTRASFGKK